MSGSAATAATAATYATSSGPELHIVVRAGGEHFAFPVSRVDEALDAPRIEWVPAAPRGMLGQLPHRGRMVGAWDAGSVFHLGFPARGGAALVLRDGERRLAIVVDDVDEVARFDAAHLRAVPGGADAEGVLSGVSLAPGGAGTLVNVVRVDALAALLAARGAPEPAVPT